jgi:hypothetical protein
MNRSAVSGLKALPREPSGERCGRAIQPFIRDALVFEDNGGFSRISLRRSGQHICDIHRMFPPIDITLNPEQIP